MSVITMTREEAEQEQKRCHAVLRKYGRRTIYTLTDYGRGETDYVRVFIAPELDEIVEITYYVARANGDSSLNERGIAFRGGGYSKGLEAADMAAVLMTGKALDQSNWREIH